MAAIRRLFLSFILLIWVEIIVGRPEQGVQELRLFKDDPLKDNQVIYAGISKSMYGSSVLSLDVRCVPGTTFEVAWGIRSAVCANEFIDDFVTYQILDSEWMSIDQAVYRADISPELVQEINDHIYLKFPSRTFTCLQNKTINLPNWSDHRFKHLNVKPTGTKAATKAVSKSGKAAAAADRALDVDDDGEYDDTTESPEYDNDVLDEPKPANSILTGGKHDNASAVTVYKTTPKKRLARAAKTKSTTTAKTVPVKRTTPGVPKKKMRGALIQVPSENIYIFIVKITDSSTQKGNISLVVKTYGSYGYLSVIDWPLLPFYGVMCAMYALFLIFWSVLCCCYCKDLLRVQYWIGAVIFIGFVEESAFLGEYHTVDQTGRSVPGAEIFGELVSAGKRTLSRVLVIIVSVGYGIVKPRLGPTASKVAVVGIVYFIMSSIDGFMRASVHKAKEQTTGMMVFLVVLSVTDALICWWIFTALVNTMRTLRLRRNLVKLSLYRHFTNTLIFSVLASIAFLIWSLVEHKRAQCLTDWRELWVDHAFWHLLFSVILLVVMVLWRPSANNQRYAYSALADGADDEAEEPMMNEAFEGVKMRGAKSAGDVSRHSTDQTEEDLKWIEENIPSSVADGALPSLLDSEEEIMTTKYELSKMQ